MPPDFIPDPNPDPDDLDDLTEAVQGRPLAEPLAATIARLTREQARLRHDLASLEDSGDDASAFAAQIRADLRDITLRLRECQHQLGNQN